MEWYFYPIAIAAGFLCGFINVIAGSGSLVTLPFLIFMGLPANVANGTNRIAILMQNIVGVTSYQKAGILNWKKGLSLAIPAVVGGLIGAQIAVDLNEELMEKVIGGLMVVMLVVVIVRPKRWLEGRPELLKNTGIVQIIVFFFIGIYGGFIQAGVGIFLLSGLVLASGFDLVRANAVKLLIVLSFTIFALGIFIYNDQVRWDIGPIVGIGNMIGAWVGTKMAVKKGAKFVRFLLIAVIIFSAIKLLGIHKLFI